MEISHHDQQNLKGYLLGCLSTDKEWELEQRLLTDDDFFEELLIVEEELTDDYLADTLSQEERGAFEQHFLRAPEHQRTLKFASALKKYIDSGATAQLPRGRTSVTEKQPLLTRLFRYPGASIVWAALLLIIVVGISWLGIRQLQSDGTSQNFDNSLTVTLAPGLTRGSGDSIAFVVPRTFSTVQILLTDAGEYKSYYAELFDADGARLWIGDGTQFSARAEGITVAVTLPAGVLQPGDYRLKLRGTSVQGESEDINTYPFTVLRP